jgi:hypothetical protein
MSHIRLVILFTLFIACCNMVISVTGTCYTRQYLVKYFLNTDKYNGLLISETDTECVKHTKSSETSQILLLPHSALIIKTKDTEVKNKIFTKYSL